MDNMRTHQSIARLEHLVCDRACMWHDHSISSLFGFRYSRCFALELYVHVFLKPWENTNSQQKLEKLLVMVSLQIWSTHNHTVERLVGVKTKPAKFASCGACLLRDALVEARCLSKETAFAEIGSCTFEVSTSWWYRRMISDDIPSPHSAIRWCWSLWRESTLLIFIVGFAWIC